MHADRLSRFVKSSFSQANQVQNYWHHSANELSTWYALRWPSRAKPQLTQNNISVLDKGTWSPRFTNAGSTDVLRLLIRGRNATNESSRWPTMLDIPYFQPFYRCYLGILLTMRCKFRQKVFQYPLRGIS